VTRPVAALTGASGFLGRRLACLLDRDGWRVRVLVRRPLDMSLWEGPEPEQVPGHLADEAALAQLVAGAGMTIHCAGAISARTRDGYFAANADGAARMAEAVAAAGPAGRLVLVSSLAAREPQLSDYAASKRAGEDAVLARLASGRIAVVRPPAIYGPGDRATLDIFKLAERSPILPVLAAPAARLALVHVEDAATEILRLAKTPPPQPVVTLGGARPSGYGWREIMAAAAEAVGRSPRFVPVAPWALTGAGHALGLMAQAFGHIPMLSPGKVREMLHPDWSVTPRELAPGPQAAHFDLSAGFSDTVAWYRKRAWL
jgi:nucleoside-diphosphate-sugar epimerase